MGIFCWRKLLSNLQRKIIWGWFTQNRAIQIENWQPNWMLVSNTSPPLNNFSTFRNLKFLWCGVFLTIRFCGPSYVPYFWILFPSFISFPSCITSICRAAKSKGGHWEFFSMPPVPHHGSFYSQRGHKHSLPGLVVNRPPPSLLLNLMELLSDPSKQPAQLHSLGLVSCQASPSDWQVRGLPRSHLTLDRWTCTHMPLCPVLSCNGRPNAKSRPAQQPRPAPYRPLGPTTLYWLPTSWWPCAYVWIDKTP